MLAYEGDRFHPSRIANSLNNISSTWAASGHTLRTESEQRLWIHIAELEARFAFHGELPRLVVHGDFHGDNLLFDRETLVAVLDYDRASYQPRVSEVAEALIYFSSPKECQLRSLDYPGALEWAPFSSFLASYASAVQLTGRETLALPDYIRCIWMQMSLSHPLKGLLSPGDFLALDETLFLADWASENADDLVQVALERFSAS